MQLTIDRSEVDWARLDLKGHYIPIYYMIRKRSEKIIELFSNESIIEGRDCTRPSMAYFTRSIFLSAMKSPAFIL